MKASRESGQQGTFTNWQRFRRRAQQESASEIPYLAGRAAAFFTLAAQRREPYPKHRLRLYRPRLRQHASRRSHRRRDARKRLWRCAAFQGHKEEKTKRVLVPADVLVNGRFGRTRYCLVGRSVPRYRQAWRAVHF